MTLLDAMQIYQLKVPSQNLYSMLYRIMADGELDERVNREVMCDLILAELGNLTVRYTDTTVIVLFGKACLLKHKREIERDIDLFEAEYDQLEEYSHTEKREFERDLLTEVDGEHERTPDLVRERTDDLTKERTPDLVHERTDDLSEALTAGIETVTNEVNTGDGTTSHYVSADNAGDNLQLRTQDRTEGEDRRNTETRTGTDTTTNTGTQTTTEKGTDKTTNTGTQTTTEKGTDKTTVDDQTRETGETKENITKHGRNTYAAKLFKDAMDANALNIYQVIIDRLGDAICMQVY